MHSTIVTGVPRGNGQMERVNRTLIPVLTKLAAPTPGDWHNYIDKVQQYINHIPSRRTGMAPFTLLFGTRMKLEEDPQVAEIIEEERANMFVEKRDALRDQAPESISRVQAENKKVYDGKRKKASCYQENDLVAIRRTQGRPGLKVCDKLLGPYKVTHVLRNERYLVQKLGQGKGPRKTSTSTDNMKP